MILDAMLPGMDGGDIRRELQKVSDVPILMVTAGEEEIGGVSELSLGGRRLCRPAQAVHGLHAGIVVGMFKAIYGPNGGSKR